MGIWVKVNEMLLKTLPNLLSWLKQLLTASITEFQTKFRDENKEDRLV